MLSRIAENLYWTGRYIERAENTARLLDVNYLVLVEAPQVLGSHSIVSSIANSKWAHLLDIMESKEEFKEHYKTATAQNVPYWLALHPDNPASIRSSLTYARENARSLRDRISTEMWEALNKSYLKLCVKTPQDLEEDALHDYCSAAREASHLFFGIAHATLPHDLGWSFMRAGQFLERSDNTLRTLQANLVKTSARTPVAAGVEVHRDAALLKSLSAYEAYNKCYNTGLNPELIYEFLLLNNSFPRSVRYSLRLLAETIEQIYQENTEAPAKALLSAKALVKDITDTSRETQITEQGKTVMQQLIMQQLIEKIGVLSQELSQSYFGAQVQEQMQSQG